MMSRDDDDHGGTVRKKVSGKKLILFVVLPILLLGGGGAAVFALGLLDPLLGIGETVEEPEANESVEAAPISPPGIFYPLEEMTVSLTRSGNKKDYLVLAVQLEVEDQEAVQRIEQLRPKITSEFTVFLRELRTEELNGSAGAYLVREELFRRVSQVMAPTPVKDLLLVKMLVQ